MAGGFSIFVTSSPLQHRGVRSRVLYQASRTLWLRDLDIPPRLGKWLEKIGLAFRTEKLAPDKT